MQKVISDPSIPCIFNDIGEPHSIQCNIQPAPIVSIALKGSSCFYLTSAHHSHGKINSSTEFTHAYFYLLIWNTQVAVFTHLLTLFRDDGFFAFNICP